MKTFSTLLIALVLTNTLIAQPNISLQSFVTGLTLPVDVAHCGDDRIFVVQRNGIIRIIKNGVLQTKPFLDIDARVNSGGGEQGLLGLAFHPDYAENGYFFVNYTYDDPDATGTGDWNTRVSRFQVSAENPDSAVASSEMVVLPLVQPFDNHNGGDLDFGPDGYLYIPFGDGGDGGDPGNRAQNPQNLLGKMLRIAVDSLPYTIPPDNPFVNDPNTLDEIWAIGLRNPWRFGFDRLTGDIWIGDVGQGTREEVNFEPANSGGGVNYGWRCYEGNVPYNTSGCAAIGTYEFPVFDYDNNSLGCSVVGGRVYRGCRYPNMYGYYFFNDYCSGRFWEIHDSSGTFVQHQLLDGTNFRFTAMGEDVFGELYVTSMSDGILYRLIDNGPPASCSITLSGNISTEVDSPVAGVRVRLNGAMRDSVLTDADGNYSFTVTAGGSYTITPSRTDVVTSEGVTTLDISLIRRHILGGPLLDSPYKIIAADGSENASVSTLDITQTRSVILGNGVTYPNARVWEFVGGFEDVGDPFSFYNTLSLKNVMSSQTGLDFVGVKLGDVNGSWTE